MEDIYINTIKDQIANGMYAPLFEGKRDLVFLDIGANVGLVSIYAVPFCKRIVAVEPAPDTFMQLCNNTKNYPVIECWDMALSNKNGKVEFFVNDINPTASSTVNTYGNRIEVWGIRLSEFLDARRLSHVDVCKVDCEGGEGEALDLDQIKRASTIIDTWFVETHNCPKTDWQHKLGTLVGNFARCGYQHMSIEGMALRVWK